MAGKSKDAAGASPAAKKTNPRKRVKPAKGQPKSQAQGIMTKMLDCDKDGM